MPTYYRRDDQVINGIGQCVPNGFVTYFVQPSLALATCFNDPNGDEIVSNPQLTSGLGQTAVYLSPGIYTVQYSGPQILTQTLPDQVVGPAGSGSNVVPFAGVPQGVIDGSNTVFTLTNAGIVIPGPVSQMTVWLNDPLIPNVGFTVTGPNQITYLNPPQPASDDSPTPDYIWAQGFTVL